ncbi:shikimate kinase [Amorphus orientalis]|uniref:Shikimate kinase n=1 Tax=Amorphus orientalis TaxID=649198 RepID=A0AAE4AVD7_9HYPH|nr:shikimate kinase [Amorphus orientalis]MDQ0316589.1 shikimate kinase [Amorphus orientalis]
MSAAQSPVSAQKPSPDSVLSRLGARSLVLVGMPGAGKSSIGRRLAARLDLPFVDADHEIEAAAGMAIPDIFEIHGEAAFRDGERRVIRRLLAERQLVLATGGGAFMSAETRRSIAEAGLSIWLKADHATLMQRVRRRANRPLLAGTDPEGTMRRLQEEREPVFGTSDLVVDSWDGPHEAIVASILTALEHYLDGHAPAVPETK